MIPVDETRYSADMRRVAKSMDEMARRVRQLEAVEMEPAAFGHYDCVRAYHSVNQPIAAAPWGALIFNSELFDTNALHDNVVNNSRLTAQRAGKYQITGHFACDYVQQGITPQAIAKFVVNGTTDIGFFTWWIADTGEDTVPFLMGTTLYEMSVGHYVEIWAYDINFAGGTAYALPLYSAHFMMAKVG